MCGQSFSVLCGCVNFTLDLRKWMRRYIAKKGVDKWHTWALGMGQRSVAQLWNEHAWLKSYTAKGRYKSCRVEVVCLLVCCLLYKLHAPSSRLLRHPNFLHAMLTSGTFDRQPSILQTGIYSMHTLFILLAILQEAFNRAHPRHLEMNPAYTRYPTSS